jgi:hypothetical protein
MAKKKRNNPGGASATALPLDGEESVVGDADPVSVIGDGVRSAHGGAMRRRRLQDDEREPVELDRFVDPSELWP